MIRPLHRHARRLQSALIEQAGGGPVSEAPRVLLDAWATLYRWHVTGEPVTRLTDEHEDAILARPLPVDLDLASARLKHEAIAIELPDRSQWIVIARHAPAPCEVVVRSEVRWAYGEPVLTYATKIDGGLSSGFFSLLDMPTPGRMEMRPGTTLGMAGAKNRSDAEIAEEDYRVALGIATLYRQHR